MNGVFRHISTQSALNNCFLVANVNQNLIHLSQNPQPNMMDLVFINGIVGDLGDKTGANATHFTPNDAFLATFTHDPSGSGKVYLVQQLSPYSYSCRWIVSEDVANYYLFNFNNIRNIGSSNIAASSSSGSSILAPPIFPTSNNPGYVLYNSLDVTPSNCITMP